MSLGTINRRGLKVIDKLKPNECTACAACVNICPKKCIKMEPNEEGFEYPKIDKEECIQCGLCEKVCPILNQQKLEGYTTKPKIYAAWTLDEEIRYHSTSGGVFSELAKEILAQNGLVCGAKYNEKNMIEHTMIDKYEDLVKIRQSKYAQSSIGKIYVTIKEMLEKDKTVLFCGTPCECAGLSNFLQKNYDKLYLCDFVCRGSNSPKVYSKFLEFLEKKYKSKVKKVWFKNKTYGWNRFSTKIEFENGKEYLKDRYTDLYMRGYIEENLYMRLCCSECKFKGLPRKADITLADFWGIKLKDKEKDIENGTSLVMIHSEKGRQLFEKIKPHLFYEEKTLEEAIEKNTSIIKVNKKSEHRDEFMKQIDKVRIDRLIKKYCKNNKIKRLKVTIKSILKK